MLDFNANIKMMKDQVKLKAFSTMSVRDMVISNLSVPTILRSMIGSLLYLTASRPDIAYSVGVCARYQAQPKSSHLLQVKRIIKYVSGTADYGLLYTHGTSS